MEIWKSITGYEKYQISSYGRLRTFKKQHFPKEDKQKEYRLLKQNLKRNGYLTVDLCQSSKKTTTTIHRIVAKEFVDGYHDGLVVNHINGNKQDNRAKNLEWVTSKQNSHHAFRIMKIPGPSRKKIKCVETKLVFDSSTQAAEWVNQDFSRSKQVYSMARKIRAAATGKQRTAYGYHWEDIVNV